MTISKYLAKTLTNYNSGKSLGTKLRTRRITPLLNMIKECYKQNGRVSIADIGGTEEYWKIVDDHFLKENKVEITIINLPEVSIAYDHDIFKFVAADACDLSCFKNYSFDIAHSNSVIEHVGEWTRMVKFACEMKRISRSYFIQTPNYWFPIEPHCMTPFFHWLPQPIKIWLVMNFQLGHWGKATTIEKAIRTVESARLLNRKMLKYLFEDSDLIPERIFLFPKSFVLIKRFSE
jgi:hypothetical protein